MQFRSCVLWSTGIRVLGYRDFLFRRKSISSQQNIYILTLLVIAAKRHYHQRLPLLNFAIAH